MANRTRSRRMDTWTTAIAAWRTEQLAAAASPDSIKLRSYWLRRFARVCPHPRGASRDGILAWLAHPGWAPETRRSARAALVSFYAWAHETDRLPGTNPAARLPTIRVPIAEPRPAPDEAVIAALHAATPRVAVMIQLGVISGLRRAEIARVHARDLDDAGDLTIHGKGGRTRTVALPTPTAAAVRARGPGYAFPSPRGGPLTPGHVGRMISRALPEGCTPHQLRHAAATALHEQGLSLFEIREFLGHANISTTQRYVRTRKDRTRTATIAAAQRFVA